MSRTSAVLLRTQSDERLVALARSGHERAFETIVRRYRRQLLSACRRIVGDARAEDVLQQALLAAWSALRRGDDVRDLRPWLFRIVRNAAVSQRRRAGHDGGELVDALSVAASPQEEAERRAVVHETLEAIAGLPERQREALLSIAVQGRSQEEVADDLGVSTVAVRQLVHRARTSLRAAATAVAPLSVVTWAAGMGAGASESMSLRIAGLIAGAGGAATFAKAGVVTGVVLTAASAPMLVEHRRAPAPRIAAETRQREPRTPRPTATPVPTRPVALTSTPTPTAHAPSRPTRAAAPSRRSAPKATPTPTDIRHEVQRSSGSDDGDDTTDRSHGDRKKQAGGDSGAERDVTATHNDDSAETETPSAEDHAATPDDQHASGKYDAVSGGDDGEHSVPSGAGGESDGHEGAAPTAAPSPAAPSGGDDHDKSD